MSDQTPRVPELRTLLGWTVPSHIEISRSETVGILLVCWHWTRRPGRCAQAEFGHEPGEELGEFIAAHAHGQVVEHREDRLVPEKNPARRQTDEIKLASLDELAQAIEDLLGPRYHGEVRKLSALNLVAMAAEELQRRNPVDIVRPAVQDDRGRVEFPEPLNRHGRWNYLGGEFRWEHWRVEPRDPS